jgi:membrane protease YdiL (CAAX protease family)
MLDVGGAVHGAIIPVLYCARMLGPSTDDVPAVQFAPRARYFSPWVTALCTVLAALLLVVYAAPWRGSPLDSLDRPAEALERLVGRELDVRAALTTRAPWEQRLYAVLAGGDDSLEEPIQWYEELLEVDDGGVAELYYAVLQAEAGEPLPPGALHTDWVTAGYGPGPLGPDEGRELIARIRSGYPANWFTDRLVARLAGKIGDAATAARAEADIVARGQSLFVRWRTLSLLQGALIVAALVLLVRAWRRRLSAVRGPAPLPPPWGIGDGYALVVRGVLGLLGLTLVVIVLAPDATTVIRLASLLAGLPVLIWTAAYLRARGESFVHTFGLAAPRGAWRGFLALALILAGVGGAAEGAISAAVNALGIESHWADGLPEDLLWDPPWLVALGTLDTVVWTPFVEELTFRGLLYGTLRTVTGAPLAAVASGCLFAAAHGYGFAGFASVFLSGVLWALAYERSRSLWPGILAHAVNNFSVTVTYLVLLRL